MSDERYRFVVEWYDPTVKVKRQFLLSFYPADNSVDMYDIISKRVFLRKMRCNTVEISDLFIGSIINVLSRQLNIIDFGDGKTAEKFSRDVETTLIIINESGFKNMGKIISVIEKNNLVLNRGKMIDKEKSGFNSSSFSEKLERHFLVLEVRGENAINTVRKLLNPDAPVERPLRSDFGDLREFCFGPLNESTASQEIKIYFPTKEVHCNTVLYRNSTCCIIKPHAVREKIVGKIIQDILEASFEISAFEIMTFSLSTSSEFLDVYKGVVSEYKDMVSQLMSGPCVALEITNSKSEKIASEFRTYVGPADPDIAKKLRPGTLRANYGTDKIKNAVHCTDLAEDALLELEYLFRILPA
ncbi:nucleoside diphosphate kinase 7-like [Uloborus diversus]|uniref:nucleoside diphosphate kinase 7-like n=1 Tax=Uloborus diversus TaxID=327109 RepID=UPI00240926BC|nr:nucleoside diphosphate kinase 7-like [Uloborus diversus]